MKGKKIVQDGEGDDGQIQEKVKDESIMSRKYLLEVKLRIEFIKGRMIQDTLSG